jgi:hypothetical protein
MSSKQSKGDMWRVSAAPEDAINIACLRRQAPANGPPPGGPLAPDVAHATISNILVGESGATMFGIDATTAT